jgi:hypothetical protein
MFVMLFFKFPISHVYHHQIFESRIDDPRRETLDGTWNNLTELPTCLARAAISTISTIKIKEDDAADDRADM